MKRIILIILLFLFITKTIAQILPVEQIDQYTLGKKLSDQITGITYIKDVNSILDKFIGVWRGSFKGKRLELIVEKYTRDYSDYVKDYHPLPLLWDELIVKHKITDQNGTVIYSTLQALSSGADVMYKKALIDTKSYLFYYYGKDQNCGDNGFVFHKIKENSQSNQLYFYYNHQGEQSIDCSMIVDPVFPVKRDILLIKQ